MVRSEYPFPIAYSQLDNIASNLTTEYNYMYCTQNTPSWWALDDRKLRSASPIQDNSPWTGVAVRQSNGTKSKVKGPVILASDDRSSGELINLLAPLITGDILL